MDLLFHRYQEASVPENHKFRCWQSRCNKGKEYLSLQQSPLHLLFSGTGRTTHHKITHRLDTVGGLVCVFADGYNLWRNDVPVFNSRYE